MSIESSYILVNKFYLKKNLDVVYFKKKKSDLVQKLQTKVSEVVKFILLLF